MSEHQKESLARSIWVHLSDHKGGASKISLNARRGLTNTHCQSHLCEKAILPTNRGQQAVPHGGNDFGCIEQTMEHSKDHNYSDANAYTEYMMKVIYTEGLNLVTFHAEYHDCAVYLDFLVLLRDLDPFHNVHLLFIIFLATPTILITISFTISPMYPIPFLVVMKKPECIDRYLEHV